MSMEVNYVVFRLDNGDVVRFGGCPDDMVALQAGPGEGAMIGIGEDGTHYVEGGVLKGRPTMPVSVSANRITAPIGTTWTVTGPAQAEGSVEDGVLEFVFDEPGQYTVTLINFPYRDRVVTLNAN
jgi:hypothetical protein